MKRKLLFFTFFVIAVHVQSNIFTVRQDHIDKKNRLKIFVLQDKNSDRYYLSEYVKMQFKKGFIGKAPLIAIDGYIFNYEKNTDTILLPLKKNDINEIGPGCLNKNSSPFIYGKEAADGAIIINTIALKTNNDTTSIRH